MSKEIETRVFAIPQQDRDNGTHRWINWLLSECLRRVLKGWTLTSIALTFERPIRVDVTARPTSEPSRGHNA